MAIEYLKKNDNPVKCSAFSIEVEEFYYFMSHDELMKSVKECILDHNDETRFGTNSGIPPGDFPELLSFYLKFTFIGWQDNVYVQKSAVSKSRQGTLT